MRGQGTHARAPFPQVLHNMRGENHHYLSEYFSSGIAAAAETTSFFSGLSCLSNAEATVGAGSGLFSGAAHIAPGSHREPVDLQFFCSAFDFLLFRPANRAKRVPGILSQARRDRGTHASKTLLWSPD